MIEPKQIAEFAIFSGVAFNHLAKIAEFVEVMKFGSGETVFEEGTEAANLYGVISGEVDLILIARDDQLKTDVEYEKYAHSKIETVERQITVDFIGPGEIFGWSALSPTGFYTSKAVCSEPTVVFAIGSKNLKAFFNKNPQIGYPFMERLAAVISSRLANRTDKLIEGWIQAFAINKI